LSLLKKVIEPKSLIRNIFFLISKPVNVDRRIVICRCLARGVRYDNESFSPSTIMSVKYLLSIRNRPINDPIRRPIITAVDKLRDIPMPGAMSFKPNNITQSNGIENVYAKTLNFILPWCVNCYVQQPRLCEVPAVRITFCLNCC